MKIRQGFVSNSSSSSFVVIFPKEPNDVIDVKNMLFSKGETFYSNPYQYGDNEYGWSTDEVAETIWNDISKQEKNNFKRAEEIITSGTSYEDGAPDWNDYGHIKDWTLKTTAYYAAQEKFAKKKLKEFFNLRKLKLQKINNQKVDDIILYCFEYSDNDGSYFTALEHGDLFKNLKHIKINNH